ncbi:MAG: hypothetical protein ACTSXP_14450, partial [Promethearchaeota archaeon]
NSNRGLNKTFSLSNPISISVDDILGTIANIQGIKLKYRKGITPEDLKRNGDKFIFQHLNHFVPYMMMSDPIFSLKNTLDVLPDYKIPPPTRELLKFFFEFFFKNVAPVILQKENVKKKLGL